MARFGDDKAFTPLVKSSRAMTFDNRVLAAEEMRNEGFKPLIKSATFSGMAYSAHPKIFDYDDVKFRRYFGAKERRPRRSSVSVARPSVAGKSAVVIVDPLSTGLVLAKAIADEGHDLICVYSDTLERMLSLIEMVPENVRVDYVATIFHDGGAPKEEAEQETIRAIKSLGYQITAVIPGAEPGVLLTDVLSQALGVITNGTAGSEARRNKYLMGEAIREAGLRAVKQKMCSKWNEIEDFIKEWNPQPFVVIVKPVNSAGSDDVFKCRSLEEVQRAYGSIMGKINGLGLENQYVLVQEFLDGTEYVVDTVSLNGIHKIASVWEYDKREANGAPFVYFGELLLDADDPIVQKLVPYQLKVLDALGIKNGPGHAEVKMVNGEPCLVEVGARCHGGEGVWVPICDECIGYSQVSATVDAFLNPERFYKLPDIFPKLKAFCNIVSLVNYKPGKLKGYPGISNEVEKMPSFRGWQRYVKPGQILEKTTDMFTTPADVKFINTDRDQVDRDAARTHELCKTGEMYDLEPLPLEKPVKPYVVVVDPFSTGAVVAKYASDRGYDVICVYSDSLEGLADVAGLVPEGMELEFATTVMHEGDAKATARKITEFAGQVEVVMPGSETGVLVSDLLAEELQTRRNKIEHSSARRDKHKMGETVRQAGIRAAMQKRCVQWSDVEEFLKEYNPSPFKAVLKPPESAGSDDVALCDSVESLKNAFNQIMGKKNALGIRNTSVLVQEYLDGTEYVVDTVSRNGKHKVVAIWEYDKRAVNDAPFVYFGVSIRPAQGEIINKIIEYQLKVLDALGVQNGPAHGEVKWCRGSPCLVEVGARCHGGEGEWIKIADACVGYNQVSTSIDAFLDEEAFNALPDKPEELKKYGSERMLVSYKAGTVLSIPGLPMIQALSSYDASTVFVKPGDRIRKTIDVFTCPGMVFLINDDQQVLDRHITVLEQLQHNGLFEVSED